MNGLLGWGEGQSSMYSCLMMSKDHLNGITRSSNLDEQEAVSEKLKI